MFRASRTPDRRRSSDQLPDDVLAELVCIVYTALVPAITIAVVMTVVGLLAAQRSGDPVLVALVVAGVALALVRGAMIFAYWRSRREAAGAAPSRAETSMWERRYQGGSIAFGALLGALCLRALLHDDPVIDMLTVGLVFGYAAGVVTRLAVRPTICIPSLMFAVVPSTIGIGLHIGHGRIDAQIAYGAQAVLLFGFAIAALETIASTYNTTVQQILTRRRLASLARKDQLTGLPNRLTLSERFETAMARLPPTGELLAVHCLDLDGFKAVNDQFGHPIGDLLLQAVVGRLTGTVQRQDFVARIGGDEFVVVQQGLSRAEEARALANRIVRVISAPYRLREREIQVGASIGIAIAPRDGLELGRLLVCADAALYQAKQAGRGRVVLSGDPVSTSDIPTSVRPRI